VEKIIKFGESADFSIPADPGVLREKLAVSAYLPIEDIIKLKYWFNSIGVLKKKFNKSSLREYFIKLGEYSELTDEINRIFDGYDQVRDDASERLLKIRKENKRIKRTIEETLNRILAKRSSLFTDTTIIKRNQRFVLPVKRNFKNDFKGIIHSYSNSGETVFIEPMEITEYSARLFELSAQEQEEIERVLKSLTEQIRLRIEDIEADIEAVIDLDLLFAKAKYARDLDAAMPVFDKQINIVNGFHPILKTVETEVVPLNLKIGSDKKILLISGPNAGGKTVVLKTVGLIVLMAKCGMFIPVEEGSTIPFFDRIYADIGDEQSIESHLSTFAAHIKQIKEALSAPSNSLVLLDELMSQTSVEEGSALAIAILERLSQRGATVLATTHNENLKIFVSTRTDMVNAGMEFTDRPTYRLILGIPQPSNAIRLAGELGINHGVLENALKRLDKEKVSMNNLFSDLSKELKEVQQERAKLNRLIKEYESKLEELNLKKKRELDELKAKYKRELIQSKRSIERLIKELKKEGPKPEKVHEMRKFFDEALHEDDESRVPYFPSIGEIVRIRSLKKTGQVVEEHAGKFKVSLENIYYWVEPKELESLPGDG